MASEYFPAFFSQTAVFLTPFIVAVVAVIAIKFAVSTDWYKKFFAENETKFAECAKQIFAPLKRKIFGDLGERLKEVRGDVLEIGIGAGENFPYYPQGTSIIAVDLNPYVEKLLRGNLGKTGDRVHLKKFLVASAEDMNCTSGEFGVEDNSVAAAVCTFLLCSLTDDQTTKTLQEVKRVLKPGGRFYFLEHVAGKPWTLQYLVQQLLTWSRLFPTLFNGCCCNKETLSKIEKAGFKMVQAEKMWVDWSPELFSRFADTITVFGVRMIMPVCSSMIVGFAEKGKMH